MKVEKHLQFIQFIRRRSQKIHIKFHQDGQVQIIGQGAWYNYLRDPYHLFLTISWKGFWGLVALSYISVNTLFAIAYLLGGDHIANARSGSFWDAFFFSVQTLGSIGYGAMYPQTFYANILVALESLIGMVGVALLAGLAFARFSRPTARVVFSRYAVISHYNGVPTLMFRTANGRRNQVLEAQLQVYLMRDEITAEGYSMRRFHNLKLLRDRTPSFTLSWTAFHPIDETSPLWGMTPESLLTVRAMIVVSLSGMDETVAQTIHTRHTYGAQDILWNKRFADIFHDTPDGHRFLDMGHFHEVMDL